MRLRRATLSLITTLVLVAGLLPGAVLAGCASADTGEASGDGTGAKSGAAGPISVTVGTLATEDFLPLWTAEFDGTLSSENIAADIQVFQSAQELSAAITAGEVDVAMTDSVVAASLTAGGTPVVLEWVTLGETPGQGRFGILTNPESGFTSLTDLAGKPIAVGSDTMLEYVMDSLMADAGIPAAEVVTEEVKKVPVRYQMVTANQVAAAVLPASLLYFGEQEGMVVLADDTKGPNNYSVSVMVARADFVASAEGQAALEHLRAVHDAQVEKINAEPEAFRGLLAEKTSLPETIAGSYPVPTYPVAARPKAEVVEPVLAWMFEKGYLEQPLGYDEVTGQFLS
jgi:NitT/TauT family transport system substrate-binding protein